MTNRRHSLVEVVVAVFLLLVLLAGLLASLGSSQRAQAETRERAAASRALFAALAELNALPFDELQVGENQGAYAFNVQLSTSNGSLVALAPALGPPRNPDLPTTPANESLYPGHVSVIQDPDADGSDDLLELRLVVAWRGHDGQDHQLCVSSRRVRP